MISTSDSYNTYDIGKFYVILPSIPTWNIENFISNFKAQKVDEKFSYSSDNNEEWETIDSLRKLIVKHVDSNFVV